MRIETKRVPLAKGLTRKKTVIVECDESVTLSGGYWDEGSRTQWGLLNLTTGQRKPLSYPTAPPQFGGSEPPAQQVPDGWAIVEAGVCRGQDETVRLHVRPRDVLTVLGITDYPQLPEQATYADMAVMFDWLEERGLNLRPYWLTRQMESA